MPVALRGSADDQFLGLQGLSEPDTQKLQTGNELAVWTAKTIKLAIRHRVPVILENPASSMLWLFPPIRQLLKLGTSSVVDMCAFGTSYKKPTRLQTWHVSLQALEQRCSGRGPSKPCQFSKRPHVPLSGPSSNCAWSTSSAAAYPPLLCSAVVGVLCAAGILKASSVTKPLVERVEPKLNFEQPLIR